MICIDNLVLQTTVMQILQELKAELAINGIFLFSTIKDTDNDVMTNCPIHKGGKERKPSFGICKTNGLCHCLACGYSVTLSEMISNVFGYNDYGVFGNNWLKKNFTCIEVEERNDLNLDISRRELKKQNYTYVPDIVLDQFRYYHPYIYKRGITDAIIELFDIGYDKETDCITFPVRDVHGNCLLVARRSVTGKYFNYPAASEKPIYGVFELTTLKEYPTEVVVCESMFNALSLWVLGIPAVALNGTGSRQQLDALLKLPVRSFVLALDPDDAGRNGMKKIANKLKDKRLVYVYDYADDCDINDLLRQNRLQSLIETKHLYDFSENNQRL